MTVFNLQNLCMITCNVACCDYFSLLDYLIKTSPASCKKVIYIKIYLKIVINQFVQWPILIPAFRTQVLKIWAASFPVMD